MLCHRGLLRIARRENGIRIYEPARPFDASLTPDDRLRTHSRRCGVLAPSPKNPQGIVARYRRWGNPRMAIDDLIREWSLERQIVDGVAYLWHAGERIHDNGPRRVRFLAPFDPLVWDRKGLNTSGDGRTASKRTRLPQTRSVGITPCRCFGATASIGWANIGVDTRGLRVEHGFVTSSSMAT